MEAETLAYLKTLSPVIITSSLLEGSFDDWVKDLESNNFVFSTKLDVYKKLKKDFPKLLGRIYYKGKKYYLKKTGLKITVFHSFIQGIYVGNKHYYLAELLEGVEHKFIPTIYDCVNHRSPSSGTFNFYSDPVSIIPYNTGIDVLPIKSFFRDIVGNGTPERMELLFNFIRGVVTNRPIRKGLFLFSDGPNKAKKIVYDLICGMLHLENTQQITFTDLPSTNLDQKALIYVTSPFESKKFDEVANISCFNTVTQEKKQTYKKIFINKEDWITLPYNLDNITNVIIDATSPPSNFMRYFDSEHYYHFKVDKIFPYVSRQLYQAINSPRIMSQFIYFMLYPDYWWSLDGFHDWYHCIWEKIGFPIKFTKK
nr:hypothetical protein [Abalone asfa-like virus]